MDYFSLEEQILVALRRITRTIELRSRTLLQHHGLTAPQLATLQLIARLEPVTAGAVAREIHLGHPTLTGILNRLERRGLIQRVRGHRDRRSVNVSLTEEGHRVLKTAPPLLQDRFQKELAKLHEWERTQILATLQRLADMMDVTSIEEPSPEFNMLNEPRATPETHSFVTEAENKGDSTSIDPAVLREG
jgi:DNA-binding MarR family transcriptional regulator